MNLPKASSQKKISNFFPTQKFVLLVFMVVSTISLSTLTPYYRQQLAEVFKSIGLVLPSKRKQSMTVQFFCDDTRSEQKQQQRSRSCTPSTRRRPPASSAKFHTPVSSRVRRDPSPIEESSLVKQVQKFFTLSDFVFKFAHSWRPRKFVLSKLIAMIDSFLSASNNSLPTFPERLWFFYQDKLGLRSLIEFTILDVVSNALAYREQSMEVDIFMRFLENFYDPKNDFDFFIYLRRDILGSIIGAPNRGVATLSITDCDVFARRISGAKKNFNFKSVMDTIKSEAKGKQIDGIYFVYICLWVYHHHHQRGVGGVGGGGGVASQEHDSSLLIDSYIDSIVSLKNQRKQIQNCTNKSLVRDSVNMEEVIARMLSDCCAQRAGGCDDRTLKLADDLMTSVMNGDEKMWNHLVSKEDDVGYSKTFFSKATERRNKLLQCLAAEKDEKDIEEALYEFCESIADTPILLGKRFVEQVQIREA